MEKIVSIREGCEISVSDKKVSVKGTNGNMERDFFTPLFRDVKIENSGNVVKVSTISERRKDKSYVGTVASHIKNMVDGVMELWEYKLKIVYVHFPMTVKVEGNEVVVSNFLGGKALRRGKIIGDVKVEVKKDEIVVTGVDKEAVGQTAANIERSTKVKSRDRRVFQDGIFITKKSR